MMLFSRICRCLAFAASFLFIPAALAAEDSTDALETSAAKSAKSDYVLQASDLLRVQVFQEDDLTREVRVSQEYSIVLPMIGSVNLRGKTLRQAEDIIRDRYDRDYLVNPQVNVIVLEYAKRTVNVLGSVNTPGAVLLDVSQPLPTTFSNLAFPPWAGQDTSVDWEVELVQPAAPAAPPKKK